MIEEISLGLQIVRSGHIHREATVEEGEELLLDHCLELASHADFDEKTNAWGITTQAVEIRDIIIPKGLEDAMSRQAQAERERQSRIILGTAETEIAEKFARASEHYRDNPVALHLRAMNMVYEGLRKKGSMIIVSSAAVETMGLGALGGLAAFGQGTGGTLPGLEAMGTEQNEDDDRAEGERQDDRPPTGKNSR